MFLFPCSGQDLVCTCSLTYILTFKLQLVEKMTPARKYEANFKYNYNRIRLFRFSFWQLRSQSLPYYYDNKGEDFGDVKMLETALNAIARGNLQWSTVSIFVSKPVIQLMGSQYIQSRFPVAVFLIRQRLHLVNFWPKKNKLAS